MRGHNAQKQVEKVIPDTGHGCVGPTVLGNLAPKVYVENKLVARKVQQLNLMHLVQFHDTVANVNVG